ncbi:nucleotidyltransferase family protein [Salinarimonas sp. NSM]|uniref:nucleotidyltransferase family protein n=1 Tax=Salinarimonas sp. NSM TaxID=3458003 RepID=UPI004036A16C
MAVVTAADLQRRSAEVQRTASREPVFITHHDTPRYALLSLEDLVRTGAHRALVARETLPEDVKRRLAELADEIDMAPQALAPSPAVPHLGWVRRVVVQHADALRAIGVEGLWVFGSVARGEPTEASDVDVVVAFRADMVVSLLDIGRVGYDLTEWLGRRVDVTRWEELPPDVEVRLRAEAVRVL